MTPKIQKILSGLIIILLVVGLFNQYRINQQLERLNQSLINQTNSIQNNISSIAYSTKDQIDNLRNDIHQDNSLFSQADVSFELDQHKVKASIFAIPKTIKENSLVQITLKTNQGDFSTLLDQQGEGEIILPLCERVTPVLSLINGETQEMEVLATENLNALYQTLGDSEWVDIPGQSDTRKLNVMIPVDEESPLKDIENIKSAYFIRSASNIDMNPNGDSTETDVKIESNEAPFDSKTIEAIKNNSNGEILEATLTDQSPKGIVFSITQSNDIASESVNYFTYRLIIELEGGVYLVSNIYDSPGLQIEANKIMSNSGSVHFDVLFDEASQ